MSVNGNEPFTANADLSTHQYKIMVNSANGSCDRAATAGEATFGILQNKPESGEDATVRWAGPSKMVAGGTITGGGDVTTTASATATAVTSGDFVIARAITSAASGNIFDAVVNATGFKGL